MYDHSQFSSKAAPHAGLSLASEQFTVYANLSRGINYPGLETPLLASLIPALGSTWQQLSAEEMDHAELGFKWTLSQATQLDASIFHDKVKNRYVLAFRPMSRPRRSSSTWAATPCAAWSCRCARRWAAAGRALPA